MSTTKTTKREQALQYALAILRDKQLTAKCRTSDGLLANKRHWAYWEALAVNMPQGFRIGKNAAWQLYYKEIVDERWDSLGDYGNTKPN
jgi:hypothetical protein